jgi:simple sugar transport system ATP-binding protein
VDRNTIAPFVQFIGLTKRFGSFTALDGVDLSVRTGSIHAILGENGAGKSTLMNVLYGLYKPEEGKLIVEGDAFSGISSPKMAINMGISMIHQHFMQVDTLSVAENIVLGLGTGIKPLGIKAHETAIAELAERTRLPIDPKAKISSLPMGMQQRAEILKALYRKARLLIFDEPTSVLAPEEISVFLDNLQALRKQGCTIVFITHKLGEVMQVADHVTVMRRGRIVASHPIGEVTPSLLATAMVGHEMTSACDENDRSSPGEEVLRVENVSTAADKADVALDAISFSLHKGEILAIAGVDGNGQEELAQLITGLLPAKKGRIVCEGRDITRDSVANRKRRSRIRYVPGDRQRVGLVQEYSCLQNISLCDFCEEPLSSRFGIVNRAKMREHAENIVRKYDVRLHSLGQQVRYLSGGNQQKLVLGREIESTPRVLVVMQPCKGLDIGAIEALHSLILAEREKGGGILYISTELEHVLQMGDRIGVMSGGELVHTMPKTEATSENIGMYMAGMRSRETSA